MIQNLGIGKGQRIHSLSDLQTTAKLLHRGIYKLNISAYQNLTTKSVQSANILQHSLNSLIKFMVDICTKFEEKTLLYPDISSRTFLDAP